MSRARSTCLLGWPLQRPSVAAEAATPVLSDAIRRRRWSIGTVALTASAALAVGAPPATAPAIPPHLRDARALVAEIRPADNAYVHGDGEVRCKGEGGNAAYVSRATCSAFLTLLVRHSYGLTDADVERLTGQRHPHSDVWHDAIAAGRPGLTQVKAVADVRPGDVLAIKFPPDASDTGHVMLVDRQPTTRPASAPVVAGTVQWDVVVIDSSQHPHGADDTRRRPAGAEGAGRGTIRLYAGADGAVARYAWSDSDKSEYRPQADRNLVVGRIDETKVRSAERGGR